MYNSCFGEMEYDCGWITKRDIQLFGKTFEIEVRIVSNDSEVGISEESEQSCLSYKDKESILKFMEYIPVFFMAMKMSVDMMLIITLYL